MGHEKLSLADNSVEWPSFLKAVDAKNSKNGEQPELVRMGSANSEKKLQQLIKSNSPKVIIDNYDEQFGELLLSRNAQLYRANIEVQRHSTAEELTKHYTGRKSWQVGTWVYFPWNGELVHVLEENLFNDLRTIRNRDLITADQQRQLADFNAVCLGMSVGSASALALAISGISHRIKLADGAVISGSNLNRILTGVSNIGEEKSLVIARQIYEMNPYTQVIRAGKITADNIAQMFSKTWTANIIIDEIDDLEMKIRVRLEAKKRRIPVLMATELADNVMLDVERFDLEPDRPLLHGLIPRVESLLEETNMNHRQWMKHAVTIIGPHNMPVAMQQSLLKIGSTVVTHPQLGSTVMMTGGILAFAAKQIALGGDMPSQRTHINLETVLQPSHRSRAHRRLHYRHTKVIKKAVEQF